MTTDAAHSIYNQSKLSTLFVNSKARVTRVRLPFLTEESSEEKSHRHIFWIQMQEHCQEKKMIL